MKLLPGPLRRRRAGDEADGRPAGAPVDGDLRRGHGEQALQREKEAERRRRTEAALEVPISVAAWIDERTGASPFMRGLLYRKVPPSNWYFFPFTLRPLMARGPGSMISCWRAFGSVMAALRSG